MTWLIAAILLLTAHYAYLLGSAAVGFMTLERGRSTAMPSVSVVVPARNEEQSIGRCLESILRNDYPGELFEVIVVDDGSTDRTAEAVRRYRYETAGAPGQPDEPEPVRLIRIEPGHGGNAHKKRALAAGVAAASGEIVITTDADCTVPAGWIRTLMTYFEPGIGMVTGPVLYREEKSLPSRMQSLEFLGLVALGAGLVGAGKPHLCNSANLAYRRTAYEDVGGYEGLESISTGDDEMLLHKMAYESSWGIRSCMEPDAAAVTDANRTLKEFILQRKRWASAHARYRHVRLTLTSILCYLFYLSIPAALLLGFTAVFWTSVTVKVAAEASLLLPAVRRFRRLPLMPLLIPAQVLYIPYILAIGIAGMLGGYAWKGRQVR